MWSEVYRIDGPWPGRLAIALRPRGGDWLEDEVRAWRRSGISLVVSALTAEEVTHLELGEEARLCEANFMEFVSFPIPDRGVPPSAKAMMELARHLQDRLAAGTNVAVHCRQGIGRSSLLAACVLAAAGIEATKAIEQIAVCRKCPVPDTEAQREWVVRFARDHPAKPLSGPGAKEEPKL